MPDDAVQPVPQQQTPPPQGGDQAPAWAQVAPVASQVPAWAAAPLTSSRPPPPPQVPYQAQSYGSAFADRGMNLLQGALAQSNRAAKFLAYAGGTPAGFVDAIHQFWSGRPEQGAQDAWFRHTVDPVAEHQAQFELPPEADIADRALHGVGSTAMLIAQALATGGEAGAGVEAGLAARGAPALVSRAAGGATAMQAPAAVNAFDRGKEVLDATGNKDAAIKVALADYGINVLMGTVPMAAGRNPLLRAATGGAIMPAAGEAARQAENAALPENMQQPFDVRDTLAAIPQGLLFGAMPGGREIQERPSTIMEHAQMVAAHEVAAQGGDHLDQVVAATNVNAHLGAAHDAAAYEGHMEVARQQVEEENARNAEMEAFNQREQGLNAVEKEREQYNAAAQPTPDEAYAQRAQQQAAEKDQDFTAARNQQADQQVAEAQELNERKIAGAEKGGANEPAPTLADTLSPEERAAFDRLKAERTQTAQEPQATPRQAAAEQAEVRSRQQDEAFQTLEERRGAIQNATAAELHPVEPVRSLESLTRRRGPADFEEEPPRELPPPWARQGAREAGEEEEPAEGVRPPPVTAQTLEERRQARLDAIRDAFQKTGKVPKGQFASGVENNASGESNASQEAVNRVADEKAAGITRWSIDPDGNRTPLTGVDAVDAKAPAGHLVTRQTPEGEEIVDRGGLGLREARGLLARAQARDGGSQFANSEDRGGMQVKEAQGHLQPFADAGHQFTVHDTVENSSIPERLKQEAVDNNHAGARGVFDPDTGEVHIFAGAHDAADPDALHRTAIHELSHRGVRSFLGDQYGDTMRDVWRNAGAPARRWMQDYAAQHGLNMRDPVHQAHIADEYAAHLAEHSDEDPGTLQKVMDSVRAGLRKLGLVREWNDNDVRALLRRSNNGLSKLRADMRQAELERGARWADAEDHDGEQWASDHPLAQNAKFGRTMEDQANYNPGWLRSRLDWAKDAAADTIGSRLAFIGLRNLPDFFDPTKMPSLRRFVREHDQMDGRRGRLMEEGHKLVMDWSRWGTLNKDKAANLGALMHAATLGGVDPSKPFAERYTDEQRAADPAAAAHEDMRRQLHAKLKDYYNNQLDDKGRELFNNVRDFYQDRRADVLRGLEARISETDADAQTKKQLMAQLRRKFEGGKVAGPYFPLVRFGDRWASAKNADGDTVSFSRFEKRSEQQAWMQSAKDMGYDVDGGKRMEDKSLMQRIDPDFVKQVMDLAGKHDSSGTLSDEIWQAYLKAMPEMSMRKYLIHRQGRLGYSMDAMRGLAYNAFHNAHQISRLEYGNRLDSTLNQIKDEARGVEQNEPGSNNAEWASSLATEMARRLDWIKNPRASKLASTLTRFGFGWYLGAAPATAFRILSQNPMIAQPMLAKFHGQIGATKALSKASAQWAMSRGNLGDVLRGDERRAFDEAGDQGVFSNTFTQDLASGGGGKDITGAGAMAQKVLGYLFNGAEHHNRMTTFLAAYRLGKASGMDHGDAVRHATDLTWDSHFDYTNANRPRVLQNDAMKVAALFRQYSWGVTYRLAREFKDGFAGAEHLSDEQRTQAKKAFAGLMARSLMFSGVTGVPFYWLGSTILDHVFGDKNKPFDSTAAAHEWLNQHIGKTAGDAVMTGPMGALSGASLSGGASYNDLWYRPPSRDETAPEYATDVLAQFAGAVAAVPLNAATGAQMIHEGNTERGLEHFLPPEAAALAKAIRYHMEGVATLRGEPVMSKDEMDSRDQFLQSVGFTPQDVADRFAQNTAKKNVAKGIEDRRKYLINRVAIASQMGDDKALTEAYADVADFNKTNPGLAVNAQGLAAAMRNRFKSAAEAVNGVTLPNGLKSELDTTYGTQ